MIKHMTNTNLPFHCLRCVTPKKCAVFGCCPGTWPAEAPTPSQAAVTELVDFARSYLDWVKPLIKDPGMQDLENKALEALAAYAKKAGA